MCKPYRLFQDSIGMKDDFLREAELLYKLKSKHIVCLFGICVGKVTMIVMV